MSEAGYPGALLSLVVWSNLLRFLVDGAITVRELTDKALATQARTCCLNWDVWRVCALRKVPGRSGTTYVPSPLAPIARRKRILRDGWGRQWPRDSLRLDRAPHREGASGRRDLARSAGRDRGALGSALRRGGCARPASRPGGDHRAARCRTAAGPARQFGRTPGISRARPAARRRALSPGAPVAVVAGLCNRFQPCVTRAPGALRQHLAHPGREAHPRRRDRTAHWSIPGDQRNGVAAQTVCRGGTRSLWRPRQSAAPDPALVPAPSRAIAN